MTLAAHIHDLCNKLDAAENENRALREQLETSEAYGRITMEQRDKAREERDSLRSALLELMSATNNFDMTKALFESQLAAHREINSASLRLADAQESAVNALRAIGPQNPTVEPSEA